MPERWESELRRLRTVEPSPDLWERAVRGPSRPDLPDGPGRGGRILAALVSFVVVAAAGVGAWRALTPSARTVPPAGPNGTAGYFVSLPRSATASLGENHSIIVVTVTADTNLPDGTLVEMRFDTGPYGGGVAGGSVNSVVRDGQLTITDHEEVCVMGSGFDLTVEVRPFYEDWVVPGPVGPGSSSPWPPTQPDSVLQALGDHFQNLTGDQVTTTDSSEGPINQIVVTGSYAWPAAPSGFVPPPCPTPAPTTAPGPTISPSP